jgi:uncharacterized protein YndB with AHSA1/START domain
VTALLGSATMGAVQVRSDRWYDAGADRRRVWEAFGATDRYRSWWPWLTEFDGGPLVRGARWRCAVSPPLPYVVRFTLTLVAVEEARSIRALVEGDITGRATLELVDDPDDDADVHDVHEGSDDSDGHDASDGSDGVACRIHLRADLAPSHTALRLVAGAASPVVRRGHDWVLDTGARQFRERAV